MCSVCKYVQSWYKRNITIFLFSQYILILPPPKNFERFTLRVQMRVSFFLLFPCNLRIYEKFYCTHITSVKLLTICPILVYTYNVLVVFSFNKLFQPGSSIQARVFGFPMIFPPLESTDCSIVSARPVFSRQVWNIYGL